MIFSYDDLSKVTDNFSKERLIGKGGFGVVYRGKLRHADVAVKVLNTVSKIVHCTGRLVYMCVVTCFNNSGEFSQL